ncbi:MAG: hypothetical protein AB7G11_04145 [Phycisphaerales bacterium]
MAVSQTVLFTVMLRAISVNRDAIPVSVFVSPRLGGANRLGSFPDWVSWTATLREAGLRLTFGNGPRTADVPIDTAVLRPDLWRALFNEDTLVRSHQFSDYSNHGIISYPMRQSLSVLKGIYQEAGVALALPDADSGDDKQHGRGGNRSALADLLSGLDVHWSGTRAKRWRPFVRDVSRSGGPTAITGALDGEGLIVGARTAGAMQSLAVPFAVYHHMPTPRGDAAADVSIDPDAIDFHQAIGSLESHPELLRALGLVFDVDLPRGFLAPTAAGAFDTVRVAKTSRQWRVATTSPALNTAYVNFQAGNDQHAFTASRTMTPASSPAQVVGLLNLDPERFGLAQVDVDGGMHKAIMLAETWNNPDPERNLDPAVRPQDAPNPEVFDPEATLPALRSSGLQVYVDKRGAHVLDSIQQSKAFNDALESGGAQPRPFFAEDLVRGYRLDVWDSHTNAWHSLHQRRGKYEIGEERIAFDPGDEEGFVQFAAAQPAPGAEPGDKDLYIHEAIARWAGWSLSAPMPAKALSRYGDPDKAVPPDADDPDYRTDEAVTPYKVRVDYRVVAGSLPRLRIGTRYRVRARAVDLAGNSMRLGEPLTDLLGVFMGLPRDPEGLVYLRYEPVPPPLVMIRDPIAVTGPGSAVDRIVIRTFNDDESKDADAADLTAGDRHIIPARTSVEMGERLGLFDDGAGKLKGDQATWQLIADRDAGTFTSAAIDIAGQTADYPIEPASRIDSLPHLPDPLSSGASLRDLPGAPEAAVGRVDPGAGGPAAVSYEVLSDPNPRPGSATIVGFGGGNLGSDWQNTLPFRLALRDPVAGQQDRRPEWDAGERVLSVFLDKGQTRVVPLSSYITPDGLKLLGVWQWLREYIDRVSIFGAAPVQPRPGAATDRIAHILQRAAEGGHWMVSPPTLLTLVHAVQQPIGRPRFAALQVDHTDEYHETDPLQTALLRGRADPEELAPITAWRRPGATDAYLMGAIRIHGASTAKIDLSAEWTDPIDDPSSPAPDQSTVSAHVAEIPLPRTSEGYLSAPGKDRRQVGYYDPENDQVAMVRFGDRTGPSATYHVTFTNAAPRHLLNDTKRRRVRYTATASSRYREYFPQDADLSFVRRSEPVVVDVPASARPLAPEVVYAIPTFGWQRQTQTNLKRSVRFGGGLRVYLGRPWYSSGEGELLGVTLWNYANGTLNDQSRDKLKAYFTQWGMDPIWQTAGLSFVPGVSNFPDAVASDSGVSLEESTAAISPTQPGVVDVVGFEPRFDTDRGLWYADLTINLPAPTYSPFVRLALARYQPHALKDSRISRVVLANFAQLTPDRTATVTADPHHPRTLRIAVSGVAPRGPQPQVHLNPAPTRPTHVRVRVQHRPSVRTDMGWQDAPASIATATQFYEGPGLGQPDLGLWVGAVTFAAAPPPGQFRLLIEEYESVSSTFPYSGRMIYAETIAVDEALVG